MTADQIRIEREEKETEALRIARTLPQGDYYASGKHVVNRATLERVVKCKSHWDACSVLLAIPKAHTGD